MQLNNLLTKLVLKIVKIIIYCINFKDLEDILLHKVKQYKVKI